MPSVCTLLGTNLPLPSQTEEISSAGVFEAFFYRADSVQVAPVATDIPVVLKDRVCFIAAQARKQNFIVAFVLASAPHHYH